jgi:hypothetical protein
MKFVLWVSLQILPEAFLKPESIQLYILNLRNIVHSACCFCQILKKLILWTEFITGYQCKVS